MEFHFGVDNLLKLEKFEIYSKIEEKSSSSIKVKSRLLVCCYYMYHRARHTYKNATVSMKWNDLLRNESLANITIEFCTKLVEELIFHLHVGSGI